MPKTAEPLAYYHLPVQNLELDWPRWAAGSRPRLDRRCIVDASCDRRCDRRAVVVAFANQLHDWLAYQ
jgi:hypothetical protein